MRLSEGRATGIPTIQDELRKNGSELAKIETDEDRTYFLIEIPCREGFEKAIEPINDKINDRDLAFLLEIAKNPFFKRKDFADRFALSLPTIDRILKNLFSEPLVLIEYQGSRKTGGYVLTEKGKDFISTLNKE